MTLFTQNEDREVLREAGHRLAFVLDKVIEKVTPGATPRDIDAYAEHLIREKGDTPAFLHYTPKGARAPYPATLCVSINDGVVHSIPTAEPFQKGDMVSIDVGLFHKGVAVDMAKTVVIGTADKTAKLLLETTEEALMAGISAARSGGRVGDISHAIQKRVEKSPFRIVFELGGHGIGVSVHEDPFIPNYGAKGSGPLLKEGIALAIEPIVNEGDNAIVLQDDGYTYKTRDGKRSAHFEHTILITKEGAEIITKT